MASTVINGSDLYVFLNDAVLAHLVNHSLDSKMATRATSNKDSGKFNTKAVARLDISGSFEALKVYTDIAALGAAYLARVPVKLDFGERTGATLTDGEYVGGTLDTSKFYETGNFIITGINEANADQANATYTVGFENSDATFAYSTDTVLRLAIAHTDALTHGGSTGAAFAMPHGGTAPYTYLWTGGATTQYITAKPAGSYTCTVTDAVSATAVNTVVIAQP